jgi:hypothetical protein
MAIRASKGPVAVAVGRDVRSVVEEPRRSPAERPVPVEVDWTWEAAYSLCSVSGKVWGRWV